MGFILSKFRKSKPSIKEQLEEIEKEVKGIQRFQFDTELQQKRIVGKLVLFSCILYLGSAVFAYLFSPSELSLQEQLLYLLPFVIFPPLVWAIKRLITWWFDRKIVNNKEKTEELRREKKRLLDEVMEKETFNVAKEILEKYAPSHLLPKYLADQQRMSLTPMASPRTPGPQSFQEGLRRRGASLPANSTPLLANSSTPRMMRPSFGPNQNVMLRQPANEMMRTAMLQAGTSQGGLRPMAPLLRPPGQYMLPLPPSTPVVRSVRNEGWMDKIVDYLVGDGTAHRFALICRYCATHNGLATEADFPFIGFRCVFCNQYNTPKEVRPSAPTLPKRQVLIEEMDGSAASDDGRNKECSSSDDEKAKPVTVNEEENDDTGNENDSTEKNGQMPAADTHNERDKDERVNGLEEMNSMVVERGSILVQDETIDEGVESLPTDKDSARLRSNSVGSKSSAFGKDAEEK